MQNIVNGVFLVDMIKKSFFGQLFTRAASLVPNPGACQALFLCSGVCKCHRLLNFSVHQLQGPAVNMENV